MPSVTNRRTLEFRNPYEVVGEAIEEIASKNGRPGVKDWKTRMKLGLDCSTEYSRVIDETSPESSGKWNASWMERANSLQPWVTYSASGNGHLVQMVPWSFGGVPIAAENDAKAAFINRLDQTRKSFSGITVAGEFGQTVRGILNPLGSLRKGIASYIRTVKKRGDKAVRLNGRKKIKDAETARGSLALRQAITGTYLEFQFGIRPTLSDLQSGLEAAHRLGGRVVDRQRISASATYSNLINTVRGLTNSNWVIAGGGPFGPTQVGYVTVSRELRVEGRVRYSGMIGLSVPPNQFRRELGFMPADFLPDVWNFLPWSWAVDYAFNVGNVLQALSASYSDCKWVNRAVREKLHQTFRSEGVHSTLPVGPNIISLGTIEKVPSMVDVVRTTYSRAPVEPGIMSFMPEFQLRSPNPWQLLNLSAVAHSQLSVPRQWSIKPVGPAFSRFADLHLIR